MDIKKLTQDMAELDTHIQLFKKEQEAKVDQKQGEVTRLEKALSEARA